MLKNLFNCSNCAREYILWNTYFIRFRYNIDDFQWEFLTLLIFFIEKNVSFATKSVLCQNKFFNSAFNYVTFSSLVS